MHGAKHWAISQCTGVPVAANLEETEWNRTVREAMVKVYVRCTTCGLSISKELIFSHLDGKCITVTFTEVSPPFQKFGFHMFILHCYILFSKNEYTGV